VEIQKIQLAILKHNSHRVVVWGEL